jgi:hypothetical protein
MLKMGDLQWWQVFKHMLPKSHITFDIGDWLLDHANLELFQIKVYLDLDFLLSNPLIDITYLISEWTTQEMPRLLAHVMNLIHHFVSNITRNCKGGLELYVMHLAIAIHNNQLAVFAQYMLGKN